MKTLSKQLDRTDTLATSLVVNECPETIADLGALDLADHIVAGIIKAGVMHRFSRISLGALEVDADGTIEIDFKDAPTKGVNEIKTAEANVAAKMQELVDSIGGDLEDSARIKEELTTLQDHLANLKQAKADAKAAKDAE